MYIYGRHEADVFSSSLLAVLCLVARGTTSPIDRMGLGKEDLSGSNQIDVDSSSTVIYGENACSSPAPRYAYPATELAVHNSSLTPWRPTNTTAQPQLRIRVHYSTTSPQHSARINAMTQPCPRRKLCLTS